MRKTNPYELPNKPNLTIREILIWISKRSAVVTIYDLIDEFDITSSDAGVRLMKMHRWGYLRRHKSDIPPRVFEYEITRFGKFTVKRWKKK